MEETEANLGDDVDMEDELFEDMVSCPLHGDEYLRECNICGNHFCTKCHPRTLVCEECSDGDEADELDDDTELSELSDYEDLLDHDDEDEIDRLIEESDLLPPEDIEDDDF